MNRKTQNAKPPLRPRPNTTLEFIRFYADRPPFSQKRIRRAIEEWIALNGGRSFAIPNFDNPNAPEMKLWYALVNCAPDELWRLVTTVLEQHSPRGPEPMDDHDAVAEYLRRIEAGEKKNVVRFDVAKRMAGAGTQRSKEDRLRTKARSSKTGTMQRVSGDVSGKTSPRT